MKKIKRTFLQLCIITLTSIHFSPLLNAKHNPNIIHIHELTELSLKDLLTVKVTSASKRSQPLSHVAAAAFVISNEDIKHAGATTIPDILKMAPGIQVAKVDANKWGISSRGFNGRLSNKLLVLIDGRSVYTPLFSGVYWDAKDTFIEDIDRIEVIRGPGATLWGANAVNGIINIITKSTSQTQDGFIEIGGGHEEKKFGNVRFGGRFSPKTHYRTYFKYFNRDGSIDPQGHDIADDWDMARAGFRIDHQKKFTLQGDIYDGTENERITVFSNQPNPMVNTVNAIQNVSGGNLLFNQQGKIFSQSDWELKTYYDYTKRQGIQFQAIKDTFDAEFQIHYPFKQHDTLWGIGYRYTKNDIENSASISFNNNHQDDEVFNAFIQDDIAIIKNKWYFIIGSKFEKNNFSGYEIQPNIRLLWTPNRKQSIWGSISKAARTPSLGEKGAQIVNVNTFTVNPSPVAPFYTAIKADGHFNSEDLIAYELGYRWQASKKLLFDFAAFYNKYDHLQTTTTGTPMCEPAGNTISAATQCLTITGGQSIVIPIGLANDGNGISTGFELTADWTHSSKWHLKMAYSYLDIEAASIDDRNPKHQLSIRSHYQFPSTTLNIWIRYVDQINFDNTLTDKISIDPYATLDINLRWQVNTIMAASLTAQNLFENHQEFISELGDIPSAQVEPSLFAKISWTFK